MDTLIASVLSIIVAALTVVVLVLWEGWRSANRRTLALARQIETDARIEAATLYTLAKMREMAMAHFQDHSHVDDV